MQGNTVDRGHTSPPANSYGRTRIGKTPRLTAVAGVVFVRRCPDGWRRGSSGTGRLVCWPTTSVARCMVRPCKLAPFRGCAHPTLAGSAVEHAVPSSPPDGWADVPALPDRDPFLVAGPDPSGPGTALPAAGRTAAVAEPPCTCGRTSAAGPEDSGSEHPRTGTDPGQPGSFGGITEWPVRAAGGAAADPDGAGRRWTGTNIWW